MMVGVALSALLSIKAATADNCKPLRTAMYATQVVDVLQSNNRFHHGSYESNWWSKNFTYNSTAGLILSIAAWDYLGMALTRHSPTLRCGFEASQVMSQLGAIKASK